MPIVMTTYPFNSQSSIHPKNFLKSVENLLGNYVDFLMNHNMPPFVRYIFLPIVLTYRGREKEKRQ